MNARNYVLVWLGIFAALIILMIVLRGVLLPFVIGMAVAYFLDPVADRLERWGMSRTISTTLLTVAFLIVVVLAIAFLLPVLQRQLVDFLGNLPGYFQTIREWAEPAYQRWMSKLDSEEVKRVEEAVGAFSGRGIQFVLGLVGQIGSGGMALVSFLGVLFITPVVTFYLLRDWDILLKRVNGWLPVRHADTIRQQARLIDETLAGFVRGQGMVCLILAVYYGAALSIAGLEFGLVIGIAAGLVSFVPYIGSVGGLVVGVGLALLQFDEIWMVAVVAGIFGIGQLAEGMILTPKLVGDRVRLHPVWVIFAVLAGGSLFGFVGMLVSLPVAAVLGVLVRFGVLHYLASSLYHGTQGGEDKAAREPPADSKVS
ncbi:MAG: AI-2E family transporter [Alphaproteobacteria bacterium]|nr:AI-2E family transporter [Alphaproteobacteria bacterium]